MELTCTYWFFSIPICRSIGKNNFDATQAKIVAYEKMDRTLRNSVAYFVELLKYSKALKVMVAGIGEQITEFVEKDVDKDASEYHAIIFHHFLDCLYSPLCHIYPKHYK